MNSIEYILRVHEEKRRIVKTKNSIEQNKKKRKRRRQTKTENGTKKRKPHQYDVVERNLFIHGDYIQLFVLCEWQTFEK